MITRTTIRSLFLTACLAFCCCERNQAATGYVRALGTNIVDGNDNNLLLRGMNAGNWMIQEGYMMQSSSFAGTQSKFKKKLTETIGAEKTAQFYKAWLDNQFSKKDIDSLAHWGYNSIRVPIHYKVFTLPIEEEPVSGQNTWLADGFNRLDSVMKWCAEAKIYAIIDLHGAPGGQGKEASISDYDSTKPSLWESTLNQDKTVALWKKIAERYATNKWIGGYDLINETNWTFTGSDANGVLLRSLFVRITNAIRQVDPNHLIFIEGNWFANDYTGLTPTWDSNMAYSFHKYWAYTTQSSLSNILNIRTNNNCPVWLGEAGENSNRWFTDCIELVEKNNIGWAFWPMKKSGNNCLFKATTNTDYKALMNYWGGSGSSMTSDEIYAALMTWANNQKTENCAIQYEVIDAMLRQTTTNETRPFKANTTSNTIYATDYDMGRPGYAYYDKVDADYHSSTDTTLAWNSGYTYRNGGVDIEACTDYEANGYNVGWIENGEWMLYTIQSPEAKTYNVSLRHSGLSATGKVHLEINGKRVSRTIDLAPSGSWTTWTNTVIPNVIVPAGTVKLKIVFETGSVNFNNFKFQDPKTVASTAFELLGAETDTWENVVRLRFNKKIDTKKDDFFQLSIDGAKATILSSGINSSDSCTYEITTSEPILKTRALTVSYVKAGLTSNGQSLSDFGTMSVSNLTLQHQTIPGKIEAESYFNKNGFTFETCSDVSAGQDAGYSTADIYLDYHVNVETAGNYNTEFRVSVNNATAQVELQKLDQTGKAESLKTFNFTQTGGWQVWATQGSSTVTLPAGKSILRVYSKTAGYNLNWFQFTKATDINQPGNSSLKLYPNPATDHFCMHFPEAQPRIFQIMDFQGKLLKEITNDRQDAEINIHDLQPGLYMVKVSEKDGNISSHKLLKQ